MSGRPSHSRHPAHHAGHHRGWTREEALARLESPERSRDQNPDALWEKVGLAPGEVVADVGAGTGFYSLPAARRVGPGGRVYAIDLSEELIGLLKERRDEQGLDSLEPVGCSAESIPLPSAIADVVLMANVLHDLPAKMVAEVVRLLKPAGRLVNIDWQRAATEAGPPLEIRLSPVEAAARLHSLGLTETQRWELGATHYAAIFRRPATGRPGGRQ